MAEMENDIKIVSMEVYTCPKITAHAESSFQSNFPAEVK